MADHGDDTDAFRAEAREWLAANFPASLKGRGGIMFIEGQAPAGADFKAEELAAVRAWLGGKAFTIYGGSAEIQNNIISKRILDLPDPLSATNH